MPHTSHIAAVFKPLVGFMLHGPPRKFAIEDKLKKVRSDSIESFLPNEVQNINTDVGMGTARKDVLEYIDKHQPDILFLEYNLYNPSSPTELFDPGFFEIEPCRGRIFILVTSTDIPANVKEALPPNAISSIVGEKLPVDSALRSFDAAVNALELRRKITSKPGDGEIEEMPDEGELGLDPGTFMQDAGRIEVRPEPIDVHGGGMAEPRAHDAVRRDLRIEAGPR